MGAWSHVRSLMYSTAIVAWSLTAIQLAALVAPQTSGTLLILGLLFLVSNISMFAGKHAAPYENTPLDPNTSKLKIGLALGAAVVFQFVLSSLHQMMLPTMPNPKLAALTSDFFIKLFVIAYLIPVGEEVAFRQGLWSQVQRVGVRIGLGPKGVDRLTWVLTSSVFAAAHIPAWGLGVAAFLLPLGLLLGFIRMKTGGIFTSSLAHMCFNTIAVIYDTMR